MILTIHQPEHMPWLGFFNKMSTAESFVILDSVQYRKNYFQNRNKIVGTNGEQWLMVPVETKGHIESRICDMKIANTANPKWREKYLRTMEFAYKKYPFFGEHFPYFEELLSREQTSLCDFNLSIIYYFADKLDIHPQFVRSSELPVDGSKTDLILDICKYMKADTYVAGPSGRDYLNLKDFEAVGIKVVFNDFEHPVYPQQKCKDFVPYLSTLDLLMNTDSKVARGIICGTNFWKEH